MGGHQRTFYPRVSDVLYKLEIRRRCALSSAARPGAPANELRAQAGEGMGQGTTAELMQINWHKISHKIHSHLHEKEVSPEKFDFGFAMVLNMSLSGLNHIDYIHDNAMDDIQNIVYSAETLPHLKTSSKHVDEDNVA